jgi:hypothetical protein
MENNILSGSLIVGYDFSAKDQGVLIVGKPEPGKQTTVINAFQGEEAYELFNKLITKKEEQKNGN